MLDDGGPAFPLAVAAKPDGDTVSSQSYGVGMSLRDWFAGQALAGLLSGLPPGGEIPDPDLARSCYAAADAMIAERFRSQARP